MRIFPYRTLNNVIDGVVITFSDINNLKNSYEEINKLNKEIQFAREFADGIIDTVRESLLILNEDLKVLSANRSFYNMFNSTSEKTVGKYIYDLYGKKWNLPELRKLLEQIIPDATLFENFEVEYSFKKEGKRKLVLNARQIFHEGKETKYILLAIQKKEKNNEAQQNETPKKRSGKKR